MGQHLTLPEIANLLAEDRSRPLVNHLAETCPVCGDMYRRAEALMKRFRHWSPEIAILEGLEADALFAKLLGAGRDFATWSWEAGHDASLQTWGVAWVALEQARQSLQDGAAERAGDFGLLAAQVAESLGHLYHPEWIADLKALAYATAAAAAEALGSVDMQLKWLGPAATALDEGTGDAEVKREVAALLGTRPETPLAGSA